MLNTVKTTRSVSLTGIAAIVSVALLDVFFVLTYVLWSNADTWAVNRAEANGFDQTMLLPHSTALWFSMNASLALLILVNVLLIIFAVRAARRYTGRFNE